MILIVDDRQLHGQTDEICEEHCSNKHVQVIHHENQELSVARNRELDNVTGEYIAFLDPDDTWRLGFNQADVGCYGKC